MMIKTFKRGLLALSVISLLQAPLLFAQDSNRSESSVIYSSIVVIGVSAMPIILPMAVFDSMSGSSDKNDEDEFIYIDALDENGTPIKLKLAKEAKGKVSIKPEDRVRLEVGDKGERVLYINGEARNLFLEQGDSNILKQKALN